MRHSHEIKLKSKISALKVFLITSLLVILGLLTAHTHDYSQISLRKVEDIEKALPGSDPETRKLLGIDSDLAKQIIINTKRLDTIETALVGHFDKDLSNQFNLRLTKLEDRVDLLIKIVGTLCLAITSQLIAYLFQLKLRRELSDIHRPSLSLDSEES